MIPTRAVGIRRSSWNARRNLMDINRDAPAIAEGELRVPNQRVSGGAAYRRSQISLSCEKAIAGG
jgi:hypothetical protein